MVPRVLTSWRSSSIVLPGILEREGRCGIAGPKGSKSVPRAGRTLKRRSLSQYKNDQDSASIPTRLGI